MTFIFLQKIIYVVRSFYFIFMSKSERKYKIFWVFKKKDKKNISDLQVIF